MTREIFTKKGQVILVDDEDYAELNAFTWHVDSSNGYAARKVTLPNGRRGNERMHRRITGLSRGDGRKPDHWNGNRLDNRRFNLRVCTNAENMRNVPHWSSNTSGFKGVTFNKRAGRWLAQITVDYKNKYLGLFDAPEQAHEFYCLAADMLHGEFANHGRA